MSVPLHNHFRTYRWMSELLKLKNNDLIVFAIIFGFSLAKEGRYTGGAKGLAEWCNCTKTGISKNINNLLERNLIIKEKMGAGMNARCKYYCNFDEVQRVTGLDVKKMHSEKLSRERERDMPHEKTRPVRYY